MTTSSIEPKALADLVPSSWLRPDWVLFTIVIVAAAFLRIIFYTGFFGSDEVTYTASAFKLLDGDWSVSTYVGANRYGINLPVAAFAYLFGRSEFIANLYSLLCSLAEIALVFYFGRKMLGLRAAVLAAAILAFLPLHVHFAGRLMADAPLALMITASFLLFWDGETRKNALSFAIAGLAAGLSFWIKPHAIIYLSVFLVYPLLFWRWNWLWLWMVGVFILAVLANNALIWILTGDFFFLFDAIFERHTSGHLEAAAAVASARMAGPEYYITYLFFKIYHTWLLAFLALAVLAFWWVRRSRINKHRHAALIFLSWWSFGLITVFSFFIVSFDPLIWIPKQPNYLLMFVSPLALLAGYTVAQMRGILLYGAMGLIFLPSFILIALQQNVIHTFTANSKAAVEFSIENAQADVYADTNAFRAGRFHNLTSPPSQAVTVKFLGDLMDSSHHAYYENEASRTRYAIVNTETLTWGENQPIRDMSEVPSCWIRTGRLEPKGLGLGWKMVMSMAQMTRMLPEAVQSVVSRPIENQARIGHAYVYRIPEPGCDTGENMNAQIR